AAGTPTPTAEPMPTPMPVTEDSPSSYGHVQSKSGRVNLRSEPTITKNNQLRQLDNYAFALVLGEVTNEEGTWYRIIQGGTEGYIRSDYFHVLTLGELSDFLKSSEYLNATSNNTTTSADVSQIQPMEDFNKTMWYNPAATASYEPFNPFTTPTPDPERLPVTEAPTPVLSPTPTPEIAPVVPDNSTILPQNNVQQAGSPWPWILAALAVAGAGGAYYTYVRRQNEKRRQAQLAEQARAARGAAGRPQMRTAQNNPGQNPARPAYPNPSAPFMPPQSGSPQPTQGASQGTGIYRPESATARQAEEQGNTHGYQPVRQATQTYQPLRRENASYPQSTQVYGRPATQPTPESPVTGESFRPAPVDPNARPLNLQIKTARVSLDDIPAAPETAAPAVSNKMAAPVSNNAAAPAVPGEAAAPAAPRKRIRRTERNKNLYDSGDSSDRNA
ncbi:MAG: SH3 domain-containing protein, partial [Clostridia bacterium]|nr:SH3 domain-containing protein [Clostridia bacterium]